MLRHLQQATLLACAALLAACSPPPPDSMEKMANGNIVEVRGLNTEQITFVTRNRIVTLFATDAYNWKNRLHVALNPWRLFPCI